MRTRSGAGSPDTGPRARSRRGAALGGGLIAFTGVVLTATTACAGPRYLVPLPVPDESDIVGEWTAADGGRIDFAADGTCQITDIPSGAVEKERAGDDGLATGAPMSAACGWEIEDGAVRHGEPFIWIKIDSGSSALDVRGYGGDELEFILGDPDLADYYVLRKQG